MAENLRVLVVDDMKTTRELLAMSLRELGVCELRLTCSGQEALDVLAEKKTDLVISDLHMPDMDGMELYRRMKGSEQLEGTQFVLATGDNKLAELPGDYRLGGHLMLRKPYDNASLKRCLQEAAMRHAGASERRPVNAVPDRGLAG
jgi:CheY-like chemotaxis protein